MKQTIIFLVLICCQTVVAQRSSRSSANAAYIFIDYGHFFFKGETVFDRFGGSYKKPNTYSPYYLALSKTKLIRTRVIREGRRRVKKDLKIPRIKILSVSFMYGKGSNRLDEWPEFRWKGFDEKRYGFYLQYKLGRQLLSIKKHSLFGTINPTFMVEHYNTESVNGLDQIYSFLGIGLAGELSLLIKIKKKRFVKIAIEAGVLGYNYFYLINNDPYLRENKRHTQSAESRLKPSMFTFKIGLPIKKLKS